MKKSLFYLFMLMAVATMPLTSCEKDPQKEDGQHDPKSDSDLTEITAYNSLSWLQGSLVVVGEKGDKTNGSHVMVYNSDLYGSLYLNDMREYWPRSFK